MATRRALVAHQPDWDAGWTLNLRFPHPVRCPGCAEVLQPQVVYVLDGCLWCRTCAFTSLLPHAKICDLANLPGQSRYWCEANGFRAYVGDRYRALAAHEQAKLDGVAVIDLPNRINRDDDVTRPYRDARD